MQRGQALMLSSQWYLEVAVLSILKSTLIFCLHKWSVFDTLRLNASLRMKWKILLCFSYRRVYASSSNVHSSRCSRVWGQTKQNFAWEQTSSRMFDLWKQGKRIWVSSVWVVSASKPKKKSSPFKHRGYIESVTQPWISLLCQCHTHLPFAALLTCLWTITLVHSLLSGT